MINAVIMTPQDDVVTLTEAVSAGECVTYLCGSKEIAVTAAADIPQYHKMAVREMAYGASVKKHGEHIGYASAPIRIGEHVHTQNLSSTL